MQVEEYWEDIKYPIFIFPVSAYSLSICTSTFTVIGPIISDTLEFYSYLFGGT